MRQLYLYQKFSEDGQTVRDIAQQFVQKDDRIFSVTDHDRQDDMLRKAMDRAKAGDILFVETLDDLGWSAGDVRKRLRQAIDRQICLVICDMKSTYAHGISPDMNRAALSAILDMMEREGPADKTSLFLHPKRAGRPILELPSGWDEKYADWRAGRISSKEFMSWSGMKKATFYNKLTMYRDKLEQDEERRLSEEDFG